MVGSQLAQGQRVNRSALCLMMLLCGSPLFACSAVEDASSDSEQKQRTGGRYASVLKVRYPDGTSASSVLVYDRKTVLTAAHVLRRERPTFGRIGACQLIEHPGFLFPDAQAYNPSFFGHLDLAVVQLKRRAFQTPANLVTEPEKMLGRCTKAVASGYGEDSSGQVRRRIDAPVVVSGHVKQMTSLDPLIDRESQFFFRMRQDGEMLKRNRELALAPGHSGGGLFDDNGGLHGIVSAAVCRLDSILGQAVSIARHQAWINLVREALDASRDSPPLRIDACHPAAPFVRLLHRKRLILTDEVSGGLERALSRRVFARWLERAFRGEYAISVRGDAAFGDVTRQDPDYVAIRFAYQKNFMDVGESGLFRPDEPLEYMDAIRALVRGTQMQLWVGKTAERTLRENYRLLWPAIRSHYAQERTKDLAIAIHNQIAINLSFTLRPDRLTTVDYKGANVGNRWQTRPLAQVGEAATMLYRTLVNKKMAKPLSSRYVTFYPLEGTDREPSCEP